MNPDKLYFFYRSADKYPGSGANEYVSDINKYMELKRVYNWRQILSNFWKSPFEVNGTRWNSVEHMFQGYKINIANPQLGFLFSLNSNSPLSRASGDEAQKNRKLAILSPEQLKQWENMKDNIMYNALYAKFSQHTELKRVLLLTQDAQLWHGAARVAPSRQYLLELVRAQLLANDMKTIFITFERAAQKLADNEIERYVIDYRLQPLVNIPNQIITLIGKDGINYLVKAKYDKMTNQIYPLS